MKISGGHSVEGISLHDDGVIHGCKMRYMHIDHG